MTASSRAARPERRKRREERDRKLTLTSGITISYSYIASYFVYLDVQCVDIIT